MYIIMVFKLSCNDFSFILNYLFMNNNLLLFISIHFVNFFGPIRDNMKIDWADFVSNWNGPTSGKLHWSATNLYN